jgi:hypothetical protein
MALGKHAPHQIRMGLRAVADDEEAGVNAFVLQDVEDLGRPYRVGAIVEGQRELARLVARSLDDEGRWDAGIGLVVDVAGILVDLQGSRSRRRLLGHA